MSLAAIVQRFILYTDPEDNEMWIHDRDDESQWTKDGTAIQLLRAIAGGYTIRDVTRQTRAPPLSPPTGPPPPHPHTAEASSSSTQLWHMPPPPHPLEVCHRILTQLCIRHRVHATSMFNGMPWESQQSIGRDLCVWNWIAPVPNTCQSWSQLLFYNTHYSGDCPIGFEAAILQSHKHLEWASMATHNARYFGIASRCRVCQMICRIAWTSSSTAHHMCTQRAHILSWLNLPYETPGLEDLVPIV
jgi:hypothetical protein